MNIICNQPSLSPLLFCCDVVNIAQLEASNPLFLWAYLNTTGWMDNYILTAHLVLSMHRDVYTEATLNVQISMI